MDIKIEEKNEKTGDIYKDVNIIEELEINPFWNTDTYPEFLANPTAVQYAGFPVSDMTDRGLMDNRLFESLCIGLPEGCYISGSFMGTVFSGKKDAKDIDIFCNSEKAFKDICTLLRDGVDDGEEEWAYKGYKIIHGRNAGFNDDDRFVIFRCEGNRPDIQVMKLAWYDDMRHVIDSFDFTCVQIITDGEIILMHPMTALDISRRRLVIHRVQFSASTMRRIIKYAKKGYYACGGTLAKLAQVISDRDDIDFDIEESFLYID